MKKIIVIYAAALLFALTAINPLTAWSQTETKQSMNTIYEKRIYAVKVVEMTETKRLFTTCLLYTSPSPRDATLSRMPSSA